MDPQKNKDGVNKKKVRPDAPIYVPPAGRSQVTTQKNQEVEAKPVKAHPKEQSNAKKCIENNDTAKTNVTAESEIDTSEKKESESQSTCEKEHFDEEQHQDESLPTDEVTDSYTEHIRRNNQYTEYSSTRKTNHAVNNTCTIESIIDNVNAVPITYPSLKEYNNNYASMNYMGTLINTPKYCEDDIAILTKYLEEERKNCKRETRAATVEEIANDIVMDIVDTVLDLIVDDETSDSALKDTREEEKTKSNECCVPPEILNEMSDSVLENDTVPGDEQARDEELNIDRLKDLILNKKNTSIEEQKTVSKRSEEVKDARWQREKDADKEAEEFLRASEGLNRSNKRIVKSINLSDVLIIDAEEEKVDNWEDLFDADGYLDSSLLTEISKNVENIQAVREPERKCPGAGEDSRLRKVDPSMNHIVEIYGFPTDFQTRDLLTIFECYKPDTFHIKWVDDNHALGVFASEFIAQEVLKIEHPLIRLRPMSEASKQSLVKAKKNPHALMPVIARPQTCPQTAHRMVRGALGLQQKTTKEEREKERQILKEAREKKRLSQKQQDDAWEGRIPDK